ncbi:MAG TPA: AMP-binding protein [Thermoanaerobaculia bacterium]|nr:AMP-binding protein [Thermoanaerobaculia bacterium]
MNRSRLATPDRARVESEAATLLDLVTLAARHPRSHSHGLRFLDRREEETFVAWSEVAERAQRVCDGLRAQGVAPGDRVALVFPTGPEFFDALFGTLLCGGVPVPLYPPFRLGSMTEYDRRTAAMVDAASCALLLVDSGVRRLLGGLLAWIRPRLGCAALSELFAPESSSEQALGVAGDAGQTAHPAAAEDLALVQFSSGTTGVPKPVALSHAAILHQARLLNSHWPDSAELEQSGVSWLPLYHDMGLIGCVLPALMRPATLTLLGPELFIARPAAWLRAISRYRATISPAPNFAYAFAAERVHDEELEGVDLSSWRAGLNGAEAVSGPVLRRFCQRFARCGLRPEALTPVYGLAEAALAVTFSPLERPPRSAWFDRAQLADGVASLRASSAGAAAEAPAAELAEVVSVGLPVPGFELEVHVDSSPSDPSRSSQPTGSAGGAVGPASSMRSRQPLPCARVGRIFVRGPSLMSGYLDQPEATAAVLADGWLDTGDRGFVYDGELWVVGRSKDVLVMRGRNHDPEPVERAVGSVDGVRTGCVVAISHLPPSGEVEELMVLAELRRGRGAEEHERAEVERSCRRRALEETGLRLDRLVLVEAGSLPRTSSGKLRRREALERHLRGELTAAEDRSAIGRLAQRLGERPSVQAVRALVRSSRLARTAAGAGERSGAEPEEV